MKKIIFSLIIAVAALSLASCVKELGAGVPMPKKMSMEKTEYEINVTQDTVSSLILRWIDVTNASYKIFLSNEQTADTVYLDIAQAVKGERSTMSLDVPYTTLNDYAQQAGLFQIPGGVIDSVNMTINITGTPIDHKQPTALEVTGSTVKADIQFKK